jgi:hypothetical protein
MTVEPCRVRSYLLAALACLAVFLTAAAPAFTIVPTVVVYPLSGSPALDRETSARISTTLANQIAQGGLVKVLPASTSVERQNYLADARSLGASYYVTGFLTPLGSGASVVEQVVSVSSGTLVFSVTNYVTNLTDIAAQGDQLRAGILDRASRGLQAFEAPEEPSSTPTPSGPDVNVGKLLGRKKGAPAASVAMAPPANTTLAILALGGSADFEQRADAAKAIAAAFAAAGRHAVIVGTATPSSSVCSANGASALVAGWLDTPPPNAANANSALRLVAYDCDGNVAFDRTFKQPLSDVTGSAVAAYLNPPKRRG